ncbi:MAG: Asp-tRNA(Asn)/Glu-tRNA(Gln) amidotransferase GatCAB subunit A, partial [Candidatus Thorarchaeota archaeon]
MQLCDLSAVEIRDHVFSKRASAVEVLESCLQRIKQVDGRPGELESGPETKEDTERVHAFITLTEGAARAQAEMVDKMIVNGEDPGPLAGVPATIKDVFCVKDTPSTIGSRILANFISPYTATPVARMQSAGAVLLGKVN